MAKLIEVTPGMRLPVVRLALVVSSSSSPADGVLEVDRGSSRTFFAGYSEEDIAAVTKRAMAWADDRTIPNVYLERETPRKPHQIFGRV